MLTAFLSGLSVDGDTVAADPDALDDSTEAEETWADTDLTPLSFFLAAAAFAAPAAPAAAPAAELGADAGLVPSTGPGGASADLAELKGADALDGKALSSAGMPEPAPSGPDTPGASADDLLALMEQAGESPTADTATEKTALDGKDGTNDPAIPADHGQKHAAPEAPTDASAPFDVGTSSATPNVTDRPAPAADVVPAARTAQTHVAVPLEQVAIHVGRAAKDGIEEIRLALTPDDLGRIEVDLQFSKDGPVQAVVRVDRPETLQLMQRDARELVRALQDAGLQADGGSLSFQLGGGDRQEQQQRTAFTPFGGGFRGRDPGADPALAAALNNAARRAAGGLDIRV